MPTFDQAVSLCVLALVPAFAWALQRWYMRRAAQRRQYGQYLLAQELSSKGYSDDTTVAFAQKVERAKRKGKIVLRKWNKVTTRDVRK